MEKSEEALFKTTCQIKDFPALKQNLETDILIIGAGLCGILTAYKLKQSGKRVVVIEKDKVASGITQNTTAVISAEHDTLYQDLLAKEGLAKTALHLEANLQAVDEYLALSKIYDFDFEIVDAYLYATEDDERIIKEADVLQRLGVDAQIVDKTALPFKISHALKFPKQAQMNPLKLINHLVQDLEIYEYSEASSIKKNKVMVGPYYICANKIIIATHFPYLNHLGMYYTKMYQNRSYVIALKTKEKLDGTYNSITQGGFYFRKYQDYLLIGGNDQKTASNMEGFNNLISFAKKYYPKSKITNMWANQDCITLDDLPYIGRYSNFNPNLYVATGFNLWGMTQAMISAILLTDLINNQPNKYQALYNPLRNPLGKKLFLNLGNYLKYLVNFKKKRCPHLGCALVYNEIEHTWDCPCHGSRFTEDGKLLDNPALHDLK